MSEMNKGYLLSHLLEEGIMKDKSSWYVKVPVKQQSHNRNRLLWARSCTILLNCLGTEVNGNFLLMVEMESFYSLTSIPFLWEGIFNLENVAISFQKWNVFPDLTSLVWTKTSFQNFECRTRKYPSESLSCGGGCQCEHWRIGHYFPCARRKEGGWLQREKNKMGRLLL